jgi:hypothetical protein
VEPDRHVRPQRHQRRRAPLRFHGPAVQRLEQLVDRVGLELDHSPVERLLGGERGALSNGLAGEFDVPITLPSQRLQEGGRVVDDFLLDGLVPEVDRVGRAQRGGLGHDRHVRGVDQEDAGRSGPRARRADPHHDGNRRADDPLHHVAHRDVESARCIELDDDRGRAVLGGGVDP